MLLCESSWSPHCPSLLTISLSSELSTAVIKVPDNGWHAEGPGTEHQPVYGVWEDGFVPHSSYCLRHQNREYKVRTWRVQTVVGIIYDRLDYTELGRWVVSRSHQIFSTCWCFSDETWGYRPGSFDPAVCKLTDTSLWWQAQTSQKETWT